MAKKTKHTVDIDAKSGPGFKKVALESKNAGKNIDKASKSTANYNRNMKGASKQSSGASKNFSKMSQGMGGIVGAYAVLAANIFAIGAAFRFLQSAGDLQKLKEGQVLYAAATGTALRSLTSDIIAATDAQVTFSDASQAAAIGKAAGLTNDQLVALGQGAKDVSIILGRDVTDSFNRLVRGVTKAEPELLDELGIILRLADASEKYGTMIGKTAQDLTQFEKSQAVTVEVLSQLEDKYGRIMEVMEPSGNVFTQLGVAFDDIVNDIKDIAMFVAGPVAAVLVKAPALAFGILAAFANSLIKTSMAAWASRAAEKADLLAKSYKVATRELKVLQRYRRMKLGGQQKGSVEARKADKDLGGITSRGKVAGPALDKLRAGEKLNKAEIRAARAVVQRRKGLDKEMKNSYIAALNVMDANTKTVTEKIKIHFSLATSQLGVLAKKVQITWTSAMSAIGRAASWTANKMMMVMSAVSWISMAATLGMVIYQFFRTEEAVDKTEQKITAATEKVTALNEEFKNFNEVQKIIIEDGANMLDFFESLANRISQLGISTQKTLFENMKDTIGDMLRVPLEEANTEIARLEVEFFSTWTAASSKYGEGYASFTTHRFSEAAAELKILEDRLERLKQGGFADPSLRRAKSTLSAGGTTTYEELPQLDQADIQPSGGFHAEQMRDTESAISRLKPLVNSTSQAMLILKGNVIEFMAASDDPALSQLGLHFKDLLVSQEIMNDKFSDTNPATEYFALLNKLTDARSWVQEIRDFEIIDPDGIESTVTRLETVEEMFLRITTELTAGQSASDEWLQSLSNAKRMATDNAMQVDKLLLDVQKRSTEGRMSDTLLDEYRNRVKLVFNEELTRQEALIEVMQTNLFRTTGVGSEARADMSPEFTNEDEQKTWDAENAAMIRQISLFDRLDRMKDESKMRGLKQTLTENRALLGTTKLVGARIKLEQTLVKQGNKRLDLLDERLTIEEKIAEEAIKSDNLDWKGEKQQIRRVEQINMELEISEALTAETERRLDYTMQIADAAKQSFESGLTKTLSALMKGEEASLKAAMLKLAQSIVGSVVDTLAKQMVEGLISMLFKRAPGLEEGETIKAKLLEGAVEGGGILGDAISEACKPLSADVNTPSISQEEWDKDFNNPNYYGAASKGADLPRSYDPDTLFPSSALEHAPGAGPNWAATPESAVAAVAAVTDLSYDPDTVMPYSALGHDAGAGPDWAGTPSISQEEWDKDFNNPNYYGAASKGAEASPAETGFFARLTEGFGGIFGTIQDAVGSTKSWLGGFLGDETAKVTTQEKKEGEATVASETSRGSRQGVLGQAVSSFENLFKPNTPWMQKLGTFFGTGPGGFLQGFGSIFTGLFDSLFSKTLYGGTKDEVTGGLFSGGGMGGFLSSIFGGGAAQGGIIPGGFRKYARGGIASSPTLGMIGEGRYNEAIVPLPNGKAIPVDMRGGAQNNNITVNVSASGETQVQGGTGTDTEGLGRAIAAAVQAELQNQKRSGGILNPYGAA